MVYIIYFIINIYLYIHYINTVEIKRYTFDNITEYSIGYKKYVNVYDEDKVLQKEKVLKLKNVVNTSYYCKDDICIEVDTQYGKYFIEFPNSNGDITLYNIHICSYDNINIDKCTRGFCENDMCLYLTCNSDIECLSNKCFKNYCVFNENNPVVHCDDIYNKGKSYMYCGKAHGDTCEVDYDCSSQKCEMEHCRKKMKDQYDESTDDEKILPLIIIISLLIIISIVFFYFIFKTKKRIYILICVIVFIILLSIILLFYL